MSHAAIASSSSPSSSSCWPRIAVLLHRRAPARHRPSRRHAVARDPQRDDKASSAEPRPRRAAGHRREVERAAAVERREPAQELVAAGASATGRRTCRPIPRPRRHPPPVPQPRHRHADGARPRPASAPSLHRLPVAAARGRLRLEDHRRQARRHQRQITHGQRLRSTSPRAASRSPPTRRTRSTKAKKVLHAAVLAGMEAASWRCTRSACTSAAGCRACNTSQWFECPCHGSQYNRVGEKKGGPAPRGLDRFAVSVDGGRLHRRHRHRSSRARRSAPTPPARRPRARTASR